jgi:hypothetical protein
MKCNRFNSTRRVVPLALVACAALFGGATSTLAQPPIIYKETFGFCTGSVGPFAAEEAGWYGLKSGLPKAKFSNLKVFSYGSPRIEGSVSSKPTGLSQGYSFWFRPTYGLTLLTREFTFNAALLSDPGTVVEYEQRLSGINQTGTANRTQLAFQIDGVWYISEEGTKQTNGGVAWESVSVFPAGLRYGAVAVVGDVGPEVPLSYNATLPTTGTVEAFGVFVGEVNGRVRIENFTIQAPSATGGANSPLVQEPDVVACPVTSPDRAGIVPPTPTPGPDDSGSGGDDTGGPPDREVPQETPPPQLTPGTVSFVFCPATEQGKGKGVKFSVRARKALLKSWRNPTVVDLRDRAVLALLSQRVMPLGALVNVKVSDFNAQEGALTVVLKKGAGPVKLKLRGSVKNALLKYLTVAGLGRDATSPLFLRTDKKTKLLDLSHAACSRDLRSIVTQRARRAKIPAAGLFVRSR